MPMLLEYIDAIARKKQRDVLFSVFRSPENADDAPQERDFDWKSDPLRQQVCQWLTVHQISWCPCGHFANECCMLSYRGQVYVDVPFDEDNPTYRMVRDYLETPDGNMRFRTADFCCLTLEIAMENAHHDEPGFWANWAENF